MTHAARPWSAAEDDLVRRHYRTMPRAELCDRLPGRTPNAIRMRAAALRVTAGAKGAMDDAQDFNFWPPAVPVSAEHLALLSLVETCESLVEQFAPLPRTQALIAGKLGQSIKAARRVLNINNRTP